MKIHLELFQIDAWVAHTWLSIRHEYETAFDAWGMRHEEWIVTSTRLVRSRDNKELFEPQTVVWSWTPSRSWIGFGYENPAWGRAALGRRRAHNLHLHDIRIRARNGFLLRGPELELSHRGAPMPVPARVMWSWRKGREGKLELHYPDLRGLDLIHQTGLRFHQDPDGTRWPA